MSLLNLNGIQSTKLIIVMTITLLLLSFQILVRADVIVLGNIHYVPEEPEYDIIEIDELDIGSEHLFTNEGIASYYAHRFHNRRTANGEKFDMYDYTAAHKTLPFGTILRVTNQINGKSVLVRINDRGPFIGRRILDLSYKSAQDIGGINIGIPKVIIEGFLPNNMEFISDTNNNYFLAYSLNRSPICINSNYVTIIDTLNSFGDAVKELKNKQNKTNSFEWFLLTPSDSYEKADEFYLAIADSVNIRNSNMLVSR